MRSQVARSSWPHVSRRTQATCAVMLGYLRRGVRRTVIYNDHFKVGVVRSAQRFETARQMCSPVAHGNDDGNPKFSLGVRMPFIRGSLYKRNFHLRYGDELVYGCPVMYPTNSPQDQTKSSSRVSGK